MHKRAPRAKVWLLMLDITDTTRPLASGRWRETQVLETHCVAR